MIIKPREYRTDVAIPPGATIEEMCRVHCVYLDDLRDSLFMSEEDFALLLSGDKPIDLLTASVLERRLKLPADVWQNLYRNYRKQLEEKP